MLKIKKDLFEQIVKHCKQGIPNEACGILAGKGTNTNKVYPLTNVDKSPTSYFMDAKEQFLVMKNMRNEGLEMLGIYHSHVASRAYPSAHDVEMAFYPEASYVIVSLEDEKHPVIRSFKIKDKNISEEDVNIQ